MKKFFAIFVGYDAIGINNGTCRRSNGKAKWGFIWIF